MVPESKAVREILFRGKRTDNGRWIHGDYQHFHIENDIYVYIGGWGNEMRDVKPETVGQFIGLTDKNGKKIFEGDIVRHYNRVDVDEPDAVDVGTIYWNMKYFSWARTTSQETTWDYIQLGGDCVYEVIGNIHDNPELLEGCDG